MRTSESWIDSTTVESEPATFGNGTHKAKPHDTRPLYKINFA